MKDHLIIVGFGLNGRNVARSAKAVVLVISDPVATRRITAKARRLGSKVHIIARTRFLQEMGPLYELGGDQVIPEEFETSVEIFTRVLMKYLVPRDEIERLIAELRADGYEMFRILAREAASFSEFKFHFPDIEINTFRVSERSPVVGKSLSELELRKKFGVAVLAIRRDQQTLSSPEGDTKLQANDVLIVLGSPAKIVAFGRLFCVAEEGNTIYESCP